MSVKINFPYTGAVQQWNPPAGIIGPVFLECYGAGSGAAGGYVSGYLDLLSSDVLYVAVGQGIRQPSGTSGGPAGFNGGNRGGDGSGGASGASGAGATDYRKNANTLGARVAVGGGSGASGRGGTTIGGQGGAATGASGQAGTAGGATAATGGTQSAGGSGGAGSAGGGSGSSGSGGFGANGVVGGGGGGGGYFGGGGGGSGPSGGVSGSGAGGSNYVGGLRSDMAQTNTRGGGATAGNNGLATLTYIGKPSAQLLFAHNDDENQAYDVNNNIAVDQNSGLVFAFKSNEPASGGNTTTTPDALTRTDIRWRYVGDTAWNTLTNVAVTNLSGGSYSYTVAPNTFTPDVQVEFQFKVFGSGINNDGVNPNEGDWSASYYLTARTRPAAPTWTSPVLINSNPPINAANYGTPTTDYDVRVMTDSGGNPSQQVAAYSPNPFAETTNGNVQGPTYGYQNFTTYHLLLRACRYKAVWSPFVDSGPIVANVNAPLKPTLSASVDNNAGVVTLSWVNPGGDPYPPTSVRVFRSKSFAKGSGEDLIAQNQPINGTFVDYLAGGRWQYRYRIEAVNATTYTSSD